jgi:hypothetical protein
VLNISDLRRSGRTVQVLEFDSKWGAPTTSTPGIKSRYPLSEWAARAKLRGGGTLCLRLSQESNHNARSTSRGLVIILTFRRSWL